jgi:uncharacterized protein YqjF (DUF2071 family)
LASGVAFTRTQVRKTSWQHFNVAPPLNVELHALDDLSAAAAQPAALRATGHRPWPVPSGPWFMGQSWIHLLFAHWRVDPDRLAAVLPPQLSLDLIDGSAWIGVTPFEVRAARLRRTPPLPSISAFAELNVRTYVSVEGKPGIYFLSLDAGSRLAVAGARRTYRLPYFRARMRKSRDGETVHYRSVRADPEGPAAGLACSYRPLGASFYAADGSAEASLTERYCAYTLDDAGIVQRVEIHHLPWELHRADAHFQENTMTAPFGIELEGEPLLHFAARQDVVIWPLDPVER